MLKWPCHWMWIRYTRHDADVALSLCADTAMVSRCGAKPSLSSPCVLRTRASQLRMPPLNEFKCALQPLVVYAIFVSKSVSQAGRQAGTSSKPFLCMLPRLPVSQSVSQSVSRSVCQIGSQAHPPRPYSVYFFASHCTLLCLYQFSARTVGHTYERCSGHPA